MPSRRHAFAISRAGPYGGRGQDAQGRPEECGESLWNVDGFVLSPDAEVRASLTESPSVLEMRRIN